MNGWRVALAAAAELGERPVWDVADGSLLWVDIHAGAVHRLRGEEDHVVHVGCPVGAAARRREGGFVLATADGFLLTDEDGRPEAEPVRPEGMGAGQRFNDGAVDPAGRFWAGTIATASEPGRLYRLDPDRTVSCVIDDLTESNGLAWSPDGEQMYFVDSGEPCIRCYDFDVASGRPARRADVVAVDADRDGVPDGLTTDADGAVWVALWGGGAVRRYAPDGRLLDTVPLPVSQPTCAALGGEDLRSLFVTTAWEDLTAAERARQPLAGHLFVRRVATAGVPATRFAA